MVTVFGVNWFDGVACTVAAVTGGPETTGSVLVVELPPHAASMATPTRASDARAECRGARIRYGMHIGCL
jgi:hypothetical protein